MDTVELEGDTRKVPSVQLVRLDGKRAPSTPPPPDLRWKRIEEFFVAKPVATNTEKAYRRELKRFLSWCDKPWSEVTLKDLTRYKSSLLDAGLQASSRNRAIATLKSFFKWLSVAYPLEGGHLPTSAMSTEKLPEPPANDLSLEEVAALRAAIRRRSATQIRDRALFAVLEHGLRAGEVSGLNVGDYDGERLEIRRAKDDSTGRVPLLPEAREAIDSYLSWLGEDGELAEDDPLFVTLIPGRPKQRLGYQGIRLVMMELAALAGVENVTPHRLRHTFATNLAVWGMDGMHARTLTRHKDERSYRRYAKRGMEVAAEKAFFRAVEEEGDR